MFLDLALVVPISYTLIKYRNIIKAMNLLDRLLPKLTDEGFDDDIPEKRGEDAQRKKRKNARL